MNTEEIKTVGTIDYTPTWEEILLTWLRLYQQAILGKADNPELIRYNAEIEFLRMAQAADRWNAHCRAEPKQLFTMWPLSDATIAAMLADCAQAHDDHDEQMAVELDEVTQLVCGEAERRGISA